MILSLKVGISFGKINIIEGLLYIAGDLGLSEETLMMHVPITKMQLENEVKQYDKEHLRSSITEICTFKDD